MTKNKKNDNDNTSSSENVAPDISTLSITIPDYTKDLQQITFEKIPRLETNKTVPRNGRFLDTNSLIQHPIFLTPVEKYNYVDKINTLVCGIYKKMQKGCMDAFSKMRGFQQFLHIVTNGVSSWKDLLPEQVSVIQGWKLYKQNELSHALRFIRNFKQHFDERKADNPTCLFLNTTLITDMDAFFLLLNKLPNLIFVLNVVEKNILNLDTEPSNFQSRHADFRWILHELSQSICFDIQEGRLMASYAPLQSNSMLKVVRHTHNHQTKTTIVIVLTKNNVKITILLYEEEYLSNTNLVHSYSWNENEWSASPTVIIITDDLTVALKIYDYHSDINGTVILGKDSGNLQKVHEKMNDWNIAIGKANSCNNQHTVKYTNSYEYIPTSWNDLGDPYKIKLMSRKVKLCGQEWCLGLIGNHTDNVFDALKGELLLSIIDDKHPEIINTEAEKVAEPKNYVPLHALNNFNESFILTGAPYSGKSVTLQQLVNTSDNFVFTLPTKAFLEYYISNSSNDICQTVALFLSNLEFGQELIQWCLKTTERGVKIILDNFHEVLDEDYGAHFGAESNLNDGILQTCSKILSELKQLPSVSVTAATRSQCVDYLMNSIETMIHQPELSNQQVKDLVSNIENSSTIPQWLNSLLEINRVFFTFTPLLCRAISSISELCKSEKFVNDCIFSRVHILHAYSTLLVQKRVEKNQYKNIRDINLVQFSFILAHVFMAYKIAFPNADLDFLDTMVMSCFCGAYTVSNFDFGLLKFLHHNYDESKSPTEQGIRFLNNSFIPYWISYGLFFLSQKPGNDWRRFVQTSIFHEMNQELFDHIKVMLDSKRLFNDTEKATFKIFMNSVIKNTKPEIECVLQKLLYG